jgi:hypothetical protein
MILRSALVFVGHFFGGQGGLDVKGFHFVNTEQTIAENEYQTDNQKIPESVNDFVHWGILLARALALSMILLYTIRI